jgi:hypothetical protein
MPRSRRHHSLLFAHSQGSNRPPARRAQRSTPADEHRDRSQDRTALADPKPARWVALGDRNDTCKTVWLDDLIPLPSDTDASEVHRRAHAVGEATHGITRYLGDIVLGEWDPQPDDPPMTKAITATRAANGSLVVIIVATRDGNRFQLLPLDL